MRFDRRDLSKTLLDYALALPGLLILLPAFGVIAVFIKIDSQGPVFHRRHVVGKGGRTFYALKFRTMFRDAERILARHSEVARRLSAHGKVRDDPRVTRVGRWLRRYSVDELPQLVNVLLGQMSLVGPRMISPGERERYGPMSARLLEVKPGLTGLWQVRGRSDLSYEDRARLDARYIENRSLALDLKILFVWTLPAVLRGRGAY